MPISNSWALRLAILSLLLIVGLFLAIRAVSQSPQALNRAKLGEGELFLELARTSRETTKGLSDRKSLPADQGMLFIFDGYSPRSFWMKNMNFPLDIIWLNDKVVTGIAVAVPPEGEWPQTHYSSPGPANMVLEVNAGWTEKNKIKIGEVLIIN